MQTFAQFIFQYASILYRQNNRKHSFQIHYISYIIKITPMRLNQSLIFKENLNVTFTYRDSFDNQHSKNNHLFQSVIIKNNSPTRGPLAQVTKSIVFKENLNENRQMALSMCQQNCPNLMNKSFCQNKNSVGNQTFSGLAKLARLNPKQIQEQIYQASIQDFQLGQLLGKGAVGNVYVCRHKQTGFFFAIKKIKKKTIKDINQFIQSIKIHLVLDQPNIVKLYSVFCDSDYIYLLMQLCMDGNLKSESTNIRNGKQSKKFMLGIAYGLRHLHQRNIRHGDIKLQNILCSYGMPKIADFDCISSGKYKNSPGQKNRNKMLGSPLYFSPQMMRSSILGLNDDVWSLGIISYELLCGYYPFQVTNCKNLFQILIQEMKQFPDNADKFLQQLTRKMLSKRVCQRPKLSAIIKQLQRD